MSADCESYEVLVSSWLDEGLGRESQRELLDHLTRCPGCRRFYRQARALEGLVAMAEPGAGRDETPQGAWQEIQRQADRQRPAAAGGWRRWGLAAAAALLVGVTLPLLPWPSGAGPVAGQPIEILLEGDREAMTESRFVELTTELLQADRKYHFAMQDVMKAVIESSWEREGKRSEGEVDEASGEDEDDARSRVRT